MNQRFFPSAILIGAAWLCTPEGRAVDVVMPDGRPLPTPPADELAEVLAKPEEIAALKVEPEAIELTSKTDYAQLIVTATLADGTQADVTRQSTFGVSNAMVQVNALGTVTPYGDGSATLTVNVGGKSASVPVKVSGTATKSTPDYVRDIMPVLSKLGCNQGTCHGAKEGKNGFKMSLRGYDPLFDIRALTDDLAGRRINVAFPDSSVMLLKPTGAVPHEGGAVLTEDSKYYDLLRRWIAGGAKWDPKSPKVQKIEVFPNNPVVQHIGARQQMRILATYADGKKRDVTLEAFIESGNMDVAKADKKGLVLTLRRGEAPVLARFEGAYAATTVTVMGDRTGFTWDEPPANNEIDRFIAAKLKRTKTAASPICTDLEFVRRVYLDLIGLPPTPEDIRNFLADPRDSRWKRDLLIDKLVGSDPYIDHWTNKWCDLLQVNSKFLAREGADRFRAWIRDQIAQNVPYDQFCRAVITATGSNKDNPAASYFKILREPEETMENTTHLWLGTRFNCNKCHDHPFERWTQDQYYEMTAYFAQTALERDPASGDRNIGGTAVEGAKPLYEKVVDRKEGETKHLRTGKVVAPLFPYPAQHDDSGATRRERLAAWMTSADNPFFAKSHVNRLWGYLLGTGIIEPLDDIRAGNPPSNPELLDWLVKQFVESGFDSRQTIRLICKSRAYQMSVQSNRWNQDDGVNFSHAKARRLPAEVLFDAIYAATGAKSNFPGMPRGTRAAALADPEIKTPDGFLGNLGKPPRESTCECERSGELQLGPVMALIAGPTVGDAISATDNALTKLVNDMKDDRELTDEIFLRFLGRPATDVEARSVSETVGAMQSEHQTLTTAVAKYEEELRPRTEEAERQRQATIASAKAEKEAYEAKIAPQLAEAGKQREMKIAAATDALKSYEATLPEKLTAFEASRAAGQTGWDTLEALSTASTYNKTIFQREKDGSLLVSGPEKKQTYTVTSVTNLTSFTGLRLEAMTDDRLGGKGPGRSGQGNFVVNEIEAFWTPREGADWKLTREWNFNDAAALADAKFPAEQAAATVENGALKLDIRPDTRKTPVAFGVEAPAGSYILEVAAKASGKLNLTAFWATQKQFNYGQDRMVALKEPAAPHTPGLYQLAFAADSPLIGLQLQLDNAKATVEIDSLRLFAGKPVEAVKLPLTDAFATYSQAGYDAKTAVDGRLEGEPNGWALYPDGLGKPQTAVFHTGGKAIALGEKGGVLKVLLHQNYPDGKHSLGRFRLSATGAAGQLNYGLPQEIVDVLAVAAPTRNDAQKKLLMDYFRANDDGLRKQQAAVAEASKPLPPDPQLEDLKSRLGKAEAPLPPDPKLVQLRRELELSTQQLASQRLIGAQDLAWALINNPAFLFNR